MLSECGWGGATDPRRWADPAAWLGGASGAAGVSQGTRDQ